jgi:hypothetical protein
MWLLKTFNKKEIKKEIKMGKSFSVPDDHERRLAAWFSS